MTSRTALTAVARWGLFIVGALSIPAVLAGPINSRVVYLLPFLTFGIVGWLLTLRRPENAEGWIFLGFWCTGGLFSLAGLAMHVAVVTGDVHSWWAWIGAWLTNWLWPVLFILATTFPLLLFPDGFSSPRWRWVGLIAGVLTAWVALCGIVSPRLGLVEGDVVLANPLSPGFMADWGFSDNWLARNLGLLGMAVTAVLAAISLVLRTRRATDVERVQIRWVSFAGALMATLLVIENLPKVAFSDTTLAGAIVWAVLLSLLPAAMGAAILRYHLYDIDRIISRTTSYAMVSGLLLATYAVVATGLSALLHNSPALAVAAATLTAAAIARPVLSRVQVIVDRRFDRSRYDAIHTVDAFGTRLRHEVDATRIVADFTGVVQESLQPSTVSLWLRT